MWAEEELNVVSVGGWLWGAAAVLAGGLCFGWCLVEFAFVLLVEYADVVGRKLIYELYELEVRSFIQYID